LASLLFNYAVPYPIPLWGVVLNNNLFFAV